MIFLPVALKHFCLLIALSCKSRLISIKIRMKIHGKKWNRVYGISNDESEDTRHNKDINIKIIQ